MHLLMPTNAQPVPKEEPTSPNQPTSTNVSSTPMQTDDAHETSSKTQPGTTTTSATPQPVSSTQQVQPQNMTQQQTPTQPMQSQTAPTQPQPVKEKVIVKEKKGFPISCNKTTCCFGSCFGCLFVIIALVVLAIFAAPTFGNLLNKLVNAGLTVPEITTTDVSSVGTEIDTLLEEQTEQTLTMSEEELNVLIANNVQQEQEEDSKLDIRADLKNDAADLYIRYSELMPWAVLKTKSSEEGIVTVTSIKLGPIDITNQIGTVLEEQTPDADVVSEESININALFATLIFGDDAGKVQIKSLHFKEDQIEVVATTSDS